MLVVGHDYLAGEVRECETDVARGISQLRSARLRGRIATRSVDEAATNEKLLKRSQERELELLKAENLRSFSRRSAKACVISYGLDAVTLLLLDPQHEIRHLLIAEHMNVEDFPRRAVHRQRRRDGAAVQLLPPALARALHGLRSSTVVSAGRVA